VAGTVVDAGGSAGRSVGKAGIGAFATAADESGAGVGVAVAGRDEFGTADVPEGAPLATALPAGVGFRAAETRRGAGFGFTTGRLGVWACGGRAVPEGSSACMSTDT
jgi:hypothetical protein